MTSKNIVQILLVEDNDMDADLAIRALKQYNLANSIHRVEDGAEALEFLFAEGRYTHRNGALQPRVILLDIKMPKLNGLEVLERIRADERTKLIPVVMLTSSNQGQDITESYRLGANSFITKPVMFDKFTQAVKEIGYYWMVVNDIPI